MVVRLEHVVVGTGVQPSMTLAMAVSMMMLMLAVVSSRRSCRTTSKPSMPGSITSHRSRSGGSARASSSPSSPELAFTTW
jgi:hypothetical protein